jgi:serine protease Do
MGLILTNSHVAEDPAPEEECDPKATIWVGYQDDPKSDLYYWFPGETIALDDSYDLGLVDVDFEGQTLPVGWPVLGIAELADEPRLGAPIRVFGYPGIGGDSITFTSGYVAGWARDQLAKEDAAVLKIDITIAGGSSGSAVLDAAGRVVGVVMMGGVSTDDSVAILDCRQLVDTNGDGKIDDSDSCQPLGGFLNGAVALAPLRAFLRAENVLP